MFLFCRIPLPAIFIFLCTIVQVTGCESLSGNRESRGKIINGNLLYRHHPGSTSTVALAVSKKGEEDGLEVFCSGSLVAENLVVTAGHCLDMKPCADIKILFAPSDTYADFSNPDHSIKDFMRPSQTCMKRPTGASTIHHAVWDIGWIKFSGTIPPPVNTDFDPYEPIEILHDVNQLASASAFHLAGYGLQGLNTNSRIGERKAIEATLDGYIHNQRFAHILRFYTGFDKGPREGDSGGPAFAIFGSPSEKRFFLIGATHGVEKYFSPRNPGAGANDREYVLYTYLGAFSRWIEDTSQVKLLASPNNPIQDMPTYSDARIPDNPLDFRSWCQLNNYPK